jgi:chemotaxis signal transduction protein
MTRTRSTSLRQTARDEADAASPMPSASALAPAALAAALNGTPGAAVRAAQETAVVAAAPALRARVAARVGVEQLLLFRVGGELFAAELRAVDEAVDLDDVRPLPEVTATTVGVVKVRERLVVLYSPSALLGVAPASLAVALLTHRDGQRAAIAVDEVEDVLDVDVASVRALAGADDEVTIGICRRGSDIVTIVDWDALVAGCLADRVAETV